MSFPFAICGLPRSRTAWLSQFFCGHRAIHCHHDGLSNCRNDNDVRRMFESDRVIQGNADSGQVLVLNAIAKLLGFPRNPRLPKKLKVVIIQRDPDEVVASCKKIGLPITSGEIYLMDSMIRHTLNRELLDVLEIEYPRINFRLDEIWNHCTGSMQQFPMQRAQELKGLNIQARPETMLAKLRVPDAERDTYFRELLQRE